MVTNAENEPNIELWSDEIREDDLHEDRDVFPVGIYVDRLSAAIREHGKDATAKLLGEMIVEEFEKKVDVF